MSSLQWRFGLQTDLTPCVCHIVLLTVHLLSFIRAMCPAHFHFVLVTYWTMSTTLVLCLMILLRILSFSLTLSIFLSMARWLGTRTGSFIFKFVRTEFFVFCSVWVNHKWCITNVTHFPCSMHRWFVTGKTTRYVWYAWRRLFKTSWRGTASHLLTLTAACCTLSRLPRRKLSLPPLPTYALTRNVGL